MVDVVDKKVEVTSSSKEFHELIYQFANLYERWSVEHKHVAKREAEMSRVIERMEVQIKEFADNSQDIKKQLSGNAKKINQELKDLENNIKLTINQMSAHIKDVIRSSTADAARDIGANAVIGALESGNDDLQKMQHELVGKTKEACKNIGQIANEYQGMVDKSKLNTWSAALLVSIGVSSVLGWYINYKIQQNIDYALKIKFGQMFDSIDSYTKAIERVAEEKANKNVKTEKKQVKND